MFESLGAVASRLEIDRCRTGEGFSPSPRLELGEGPVSSTREWLPAIACERGRAARREAREAGMGRPSGCQEDHPGSE